MDAIYNGKEELKKHFPAIMDRGYLDGKVKYLMTTAYGASLHEIRRMVDRQFQYVFNLLENMILCVT